MTRPDYFLVLQMPLATKLGQKETTKLTSTVSPTLKEEDSFLGARVERRTGRPMMLRFLLWRMPLIDRCVEVVCADDDR